MLKKHLSALDALTYRVNVQHNFQNCVVVVFLFSSNTFCESCFNEFCIPNKVKIHFIYGYLFFSVCKKDKIVDDLWHKLNMVEKNNNTIKLHVLDIFLNTGPSHAGNIVTLVFQSLIWLTLFFFKSFELCC